MASKYKGIILAGGSGTRLHPITRGVSKHLLAIYDKPMIYYPLSVLMNSGIRDILIICTTEDLESYQRLLQDGSEFGIKISYKIQPSPDGLAQAFILGEEFIGNENVALVLGDNIFYGQHLVDHLNLATSKIVGATIFGFNVKDPERFGVVDFDKNGKVLSIEEKPKIPKSNYAVTGLYFYDNQVIDIAKSLKPSQRGELEITDVNKTYLENGLLNVELLEDGFFWLDTGTHESLFEASKFIKSIEDQHSIKVACLEEIAFYQKWIDKKNLIKKANTLSKTNYGKYLLNLANNFNENH